MSYQKIYEYVIVPEASFPIIRNCSVCGCKSTFVNSNHFRVNANGNRIDVWLIYQCKKCRHTYNLTIYERVKADRLPLDQFIGFIENEEALAMKYGTDKAFFAKNRAEIDWRSGIPYQIMNAESRLCAADEVLRFSCGDIIRINNPCGLKVRTDKITAEILHVTRNTAKQMEETGYFKILINNPDPTIQSIL